RLAYAPHPARLRHAPRERAPPGLDRAGGQPAFVLDQDLAGLEPLSEPRQCHDRRDRLAEADDVADATHGQKLAVAPQIAWPPRQRLLAQCLFDAVEIVANDERLALAREGVELVRPAAGAGGPTIKTRDGRGGV